MARKPNDAERFFTAFYEESERGCVLVANATIDDLMASILKAEFKRHAGRRNSKLAKYSEALLTRRPLPPLGSSYVRASLLYVLGIFDNKLLSALEAIRGMRNSAAHVNASFSIADFDLTLISAALTPAEHSDKHDMTLRRHIQGDRSKEEILFRKCAIAVIAKLIHLAHEPERARQILACKNIWRLPSKRDRKRRQRQSRSGSSDSAVSEAKT